jgi:PIN domain nuclease of toxin-antitoxin system
LKRLLLDSHVFLWWLVNDQRLGVKARGLIQDPKNQIFVSAATTWEISIKRALGKIYAPEDMSSIIDDEGFIALSISAYHGDQAGLLPDLHKDPFDRMLIAQAQSEGLVLVTADEKIFKYPLRIIKANE